MNQFDPATGRFVPAARRVDVTARDRRTLEVRQHYGLPHERDGKTRYETKLWLFFPRGFGISPQTFSAEEFYKDAHTYMRMHAPALRLKDFADLEHPTNPAAILRRQLPNLVEDEAPTAAALDTLAKTLGAELVDSVTTTTRALITRIHDVDVADDKGALVRDVDACCTDTLRALGAVRRVRAKARAYRTVAPTLLPALAFAEEYISAVVDERLAELAHAIDAAPALRDGSGAAVGMRLAVARCADAVHRRRREQGFPIPQGSERGTAANEYFAYRMGALKKEVQRALYVDTRANRADPFWRNSAAALAAGLAATWALLAQVQLFNDGLSSRQSVILFAAAVVAYMLKDRIKEWTRAMLTRKFLRWDHNERIVGDALQCAGLGKIGGRAAELARWVKAEDLPKNVAALRQRVRTVRGVAELENIFLVHRQVTLESDDDPTPSGFGVQELFRLSLDEILKRLDDPVDPLAFYDPDAGTFAQASLPKIYHLNIIAHSLDHNTQNESFTRFRVVVNQEGIVRIDRVLDRVAAQPSLVPTLIDSVAE
jgi:hypothetical protein